MRSRAEAAAMVFGVSMLYALGTVAAEIPFPSKSIRIIVPFPPGGNVDINARAIAPGLSEVLGQSVVVDNRPGASGQIGAEAVAKAPPDGYTLMVASSMLIVPYKGAGPALTDLLGGHVDTRIDQISSSMPHIRSGKLRAIALTTAQRAALLPDVPTVAESGVPGFEGSVVTGMLAPAATPAEIVQRLNAALNRVLADAALVERFASLGGEVRSGSSEELAKFIREDLARWRKVVREAGIKVE